MAFRNKYRLAGEKRFHKNAIFLLNVRQIRSVQWEVYNKQRHQPGKISVQEGNRPGRDEKRVDFDAKTAKQAYTGLS